MKKIIALALCLLPVAAFAADATSRASNSGVAAAVAVSRGTIAPERATNAVEPRGASVASRNVVATETDSRDKVETAAATVGRSATTTATAATRRSGVITRPSVSGTISRAADAVAARATTEPTVSARTSNTTPARSTVVGRATISTRLPSVAGRNDLPTAASIAEATEKLQNTAALHTSCQAQYNDCMDQFCAVLDANQKRCSCSANLSHYTRVENAVKDANMELNDVAQRIRYVGLSADEIRAIMTATEAELVLDGTTDKTESRDMLSQIEDLIKNPAAAMTSPEGGLSMLDLDLDFTGDPASIFNLDFLGGTASSFANMRGTQLFTNAKKRCQPILARCAAAGGEQAQITANYDLAIDRDCIAYEAGLDKMNETLLSNVRSANLMLQKARLAVLSNKNQFDAKGCVGALDACMTDEMVCGADYTKCLDPTKRFIDENGNVVLGRNISTILRFMTNYNNAAINRAFLISARNVQYTENSCTGTSGNNGMCNVRYLLEKIGMGEKPTDGGLCRAVLDKCQRYSYNDKGQYDEYNDVIVQYVQRAMVNVESGQRKLIANYAENCMVDVAACYNQQVAQVNAWSSNAATDSVYNVMRGACRNIALTCAYGVFYGNTQGLCRTDDACINDISEMFYQSLLCPDNSTHQATSGNRDAPGTAGGWVNNRCRCDTGYVVWGTSCQKLCVAGSYRNQNTGICTMCPAGSYCSGASSSSESTKPTTCGDDYTSKAGSDSASDCNIQISTGGGTEPPPDDDPQQTCVATPDLCSAYSNAECTNTSGTAGNGSYVATNCTCKSGYHVESVSGATVSYTCVSNTTSGRQSCAVNSDQCSGVANSVCTDTPGTPGTTAGYASQYCKCATGFSVVEKDSGRLITKVYECLRASCPIDSSPDSNCPRMASDILSTVIDIEYNISQLSGGTNYWAIQMAKCMRGSSYTGCKCSNEALGGNTMCGGRPYSVRSTTGAPAGYRTCAEDHPGSAHISEYGITRLGLPGYTVNSDKQYVSLTCICKPGYVYSDVMGSGHGQCVPSSNCPPGQPGTGECAQTVE